MALLDGLYVSTACTGRNVGAGPSANAQPVDAAYGGAFPATGPPPSDDGDESDDPRSVGWVDSSPARADDGNRDGGGSEAASVANGAADAGPEGACTQPLGPGDLRIDEMMIESVAGSGDNGEWLEIGSTLDCAANLNGVHGECPHGSKVSTFEVEGDLWVPPHGTFVVADSSDPAINHALPGVVVVWFGHPGDVLRNQGSTVTLSLYGTMLDTVTYPALTLAVGASVAFPSNCDPSQRSDFSQWKRSTSSWFPGFLGTPNAPNTDVHCPP